MTLELTSETEYAIRQRAQESGLSVDEFLARTFTATAKDPDDVLDLIQKWQREFGLPPRPDGKTHTSVTELLAEWDKEDANRTFNQIQADEQLWADLNRDFHRTEI